MNQLLFLAHEGHDHGAEAVDPAIHAPWWSNELALNGAVVLGFIGLMVLAAYVLKLKPATRLILAMAYLLVMGVLAYRFSPILSITALAVGMALALTTTLIQLAKPQKPHRQQ